MSKERLTKAQETLLAEKFLHRASLYLREEFPEKTKDLTEEELTKEILQGAMRASSYGFETEKSVMGFIDLLMRISYTFDTDQDTEWAQLVLTDTDKTQDEKIEALRQAYVFYTAITADEE